MSGPDSNITNDPQWLRELEKELGLDNTPTPEASGEEITLLEGIQRTEFTVDGWTRVYKLIMSAEQNPAFFQRLLKNADDAMLFTAMIALPYQMSLSMGQNPRYSEKLVAFVAASYIIAVTRGYKMGQDDAAKNDAQAKD